jgi:ABC-type multidrug transport system fused ATPase/permease subunit
MLLLAGEHLCTASRHQRCFRKLLASKVEEYHVGPERSNMRNHRAGRFASIERLQPNRMLERAFCRCKGTSESPASYASGAVLDAISVRSLSVRFGATVALDDVTVSVPRSSLTMIVGPPGAGKTVLMKSLSCELEWGGGTIWIQDVPARL